MAELAGVVASGIAITGLAGQLAKHTLTLKKLWNDAQDAPKSICDLNDQLNLASMIVMEMEASFLQAPDDFKNTSTAKLIIQRCKTAADDLGALGDELSKSLNSSNWTRRTKGKLKSVIRKDYIENYQKRLERTLQLLMLSYQLYSTHTIRTLPGLAFAKSDNTQPQDLVTDTTEDKTLAYINNLSHFQNRKSDKNDPIAFSYHRGILSACLGSISYRTQSQKAENEGDSTRYRICFQLPFWISNRIWEMYSNQASSGWRIFLRTRNVRPYDDNILAILEKGSILQLLQLFSDQNRTILDVDKRGRSILHLAVQFTRWDIVLELIKLGAPMDEADVYRRTPFTSMCLNNNNTLVIFRHLASTGLLYDLAELRLQFSDYISSTTDIERARFKVPGVCGIISTLPYISTPELSWTNISWVWAQPELLLEMSRQNQISSLLRFQTEPVDDRPRSIIAFMESYFRHEFTTARKRGSGKAMELSGWRRLCRHVLGGVSLETLCKLRPTGDIFRLISFIGHVQHGTNPNVVSPREHRRIIVGVIGGWLEDLADCGIDLEEYGKTERLHMPSPVYGTCCSKKEQNITRFTYCGLTLFNFSYGKRSQDWILEWDFFSPEFAKDFWNLVDPKPLCMPGSWIDIEGI